MDSKKVVHFIERDFFEEFAGRSKYLTHSFHNEDSSGSKLNVSK